jgi:branched-chain amino acid transport system substrate-binding protein
LLVAGACGPGQPAAAPSSPRPSPPARVDLGEIRIGALFPVTGGAAAGGLDALHGVQLAAEVLDGRHPEIDLPALTVARIALDVADTRGDLGVAAAAVDRMVHGDHVAALAGAYQSNVTLAAGQRAELAGVPMISGSAAAPTLTSRGMRWFWRVGPSQRTYADAYFQWLRSVAARHPVTHVVVLHEDGDAGDEVAALVKEVAPRYQVQVDEDVRYAAEATDLFPQVLRLKGYAPDALFVFASSATAAPLLRTMARVGYTPPALLAFDAGFGDLRLVREVGGEADYVITRAAWSPEVARANPTARAVADLFRQRFGQDMTETSAVEFEAMMTLGLAIESADSSEPQRIQAALQRTDRRRTITSWPGVRFDASGQNALAGAVIEQLLNGQYRAVYPAAVASVRVTWPAPPLERR